MDNLVFRGEEAGQRGRRGDRRLCQYLLYPLNAKLNPICHLLALLGAHHILHFSRIRVNSQPVNAKHQSQYTGSWNSTAGYIG